MNSIWNNNIAQFSSRFPQLASAYKLTEQSEESSPWKLTEAKNGSITAEENGVLIHSRYNPEHEASQLIASASVSVPEIDAGLFLGFGLGYGPVSFAQSHPEDTLIIVEPDPSYFFAALCTIDWTPVFAQKKCIILLEARSEDIVPLVEQSGGFAHCAVFSTQQQTAHAQNYFNQIKLLIQRNKQKEKINAYTLEKFSSLWLRNSCRNLRPFSTLDGVKKYENACTESLPVLILAAGPTLSETLPYLHELKKRMMLICVDTSLRACLRCGVEPDFVIIVDPQYYAWRHIADLSSPSSVLITESAVYPAASHFVCKEKVLCSSLFPLGKYFESKLGSRGELGAGGSVSTTAWDFARLCGAKKIYVSGLDLGYPSRETHARGSIFEESAHRTSQRTSTAETTGASSLFGANMTTGRDYAGNEILTDDRMKLFSWWFESKAASFPEIKTYSLSLRSLAIPGFGTADAASLLSLPEAEAERKQFFDTANAHSQIPDKQIFEKTYTELLAGFDELYAAARKGESTAEEGIKKIHSTHTSADISSYIQILNKIDARILTSSLKDAASLVFPSEKALDALFASSTLPSDKTEAMFARSRIIYRELQKAIARYRIQLS